MGKTGTAQVPRRDKHGYEEGAYLSSFMAAVPASDPQLACLVMIRKPNKKIAYYGSQVSAPVVKAIFEEALPYLNVPPDKDPAARKGQEAGASGEQLSPRRAEFARKIGDRRRHAGQRVTSAWGGDGGIC